MYKNVQWLLLAGEQKLELRPAAQVLNSSDSLLPSTLARNKHSSGLKSPFPKMHNRNGWFSAELSMQSYGAGGPQAYLKQFLWSPVGTGQIHLQL